MATDFEILLPLGTHRAARAAEDALGLVERLESQLTAFREDSEVSRVNRFAAFSPLPVEPRLFELLQSAVRIHRDTGGAYDLAAGALIKTWSNCRRQSRLPSQEELKEALSRSGMDNLVLDPERRTIHYRKPGIEINLGSIGKGYALDRAAQLLRTNWSIHSALLHAGSSSVLTMGAPPGEPQGWLVGLGNPSNSMHRLGVIWLRNGALGTSAPTFQHMTTHGRKLGHILDPRSGLPAEKVASASALAPTAAQADALSTAFFVLGLDGTRDYSEKHPDVSSVLLPHGRGAPVPFGNFNIASRSDSV